MGRPVRGSHGQSERGIARPEILAGLELVARTAERLYVPVRVRPAQRERLYVVHVDVRREDMPTTAHALPAPRLPDDPAEPSGSRVAPCENLPTLPPSPYRRTLLVSLVVGLTAAPMGRRLRTVDTAHVHPLVVAPGARCLVNERAGQLPIGGTCGTARMVQ